MARSGSGGLGWMMLDRFVFRRDDAKDDDACGWAASHTTSLGKRFDIAFFPVEPPAISRLYVRWPGGTKLEDSNGTDLVASHHDLLLFRLTSIEKLDEYPYLRHTQDHFIIICCVDDDASSYPLRLKQLPVCTAPLVLPSPKEGKEDIIMQRVFFPHTVGLLCRGEEFAVAQLTMVSGNRSRMVEAQVCVLHSRVSAADNDDDDGNNWEVKKLSVQHSEDEYSDLYYWSTVSVITFNNCICWVNYHRGGILFYQALEQESPNISYLRLPINNRPLGSSQAKAFLEMNRSVCVTQQGGEQVLKFIDVIRAGSNFAIISYILRTTESGDMKWDKDGVMTSNQLWSRNTSECLPRNILMFPLVSMFKPHVVHFLLSEEGDDEIDKVSVVTIDMITKTLDSIVPYINGVEDLHGEDSDMVEEKSHLLKSFLPSESFSKFLKLTRKSLLDSGASPVNKVWQYDGLRDPNSS